VEGSMPRDRAPNDHPSGRPPRPPEAVQSATAPSRSPLHKARTWRYSE
jgi:hypothetical protein